MKAFIFFIVLLFSATGECESCDQSGAVGIATKLADILVKLNGFTEALQANGVSDNGTLFDLGFRTPEDIEVQVLKDGCAVSLITLYPGQMGKPPKCEEKNALARGILANDALVNANGDT